MAIQETRNPKERAAVLDALDYDGNVGSQVRYFGYTIELEAETVWYFGEADNGRVRIGPETSRREAILEACDFIDDAREGYTR